MKLFFMMNSKREFNERNSNKVDNEISSKYFNKAIKHNINIKNM